MVITPSLISKWPPSLILGCFPVRGTERMTWMIFANNINKIILRQWSPLN